MTFWVLAGMLAAAAVGIVIGPLRKEHLRLAILLTFLIPLLALALYFIGGNPELAR
jgi:hypothetical protein